MAFYKLKVTIFQPINTTAMENFIHFNSANLHYSLLSYRETSLKTYFLKLMHWKHKVKVRDIHALRDVSFEIGPGERVGLIGHNGAGKSTLLKAIANLYPLSSGVLKIKGEVRALFELTLGFEQEATGRENILYRGLLMNQTPKKMKQLEDEIVTFADLGQFIDYPIKTYSSGMLIRLAFAISSTVPSDILLLDEVVGAGDATFMKKANQRLHSLLEQTKIMMLASHDFSAIKTFCTRVFVLHQGSLVFDGSPEEGIAFYHEKNGLM